jgi:hypothetical protein
MKNGIKAEQKMPQKLMRFEVESGCAHMKKPTQMMKKAATIRKQMLHAAKILHELISSQS